MADLPLTALEDPLILALGGFVILSVLLGLLLLSRSKQSSLLLEQMSGLRQQIQGMEDENRRLAEESVIGKERAEQLERLKNEHQSLKDSYQSLQQDKQELDKRCVKLSTQSEEEQKRYAETIEQLKATKDSITKDFENLANRIFDEKTNRFSQLSQTNINQTLNPLRDQLKDFRQRVDSIYNTESQDRAALKEQISQLKNLNQQMSEDAVNLTNALKGENKVQGNWGEIILERLLEDSGLRKGYEYETQVNLRGSEGERRAPDVIVRLPDNKDIVVDAKVSLTDYERYCSSDDDTEKLQALKGHITSLKGHIDGISLKSYENLEGLRTLDFVFIFVPIEAAFLLAFEHDPGLFRTAYDKNVIVVSPTTLLATLRTVQSVWRYERQNRNAEEIANRAGLLHQQVALLLEDFDELGKQLGKAQQAWDSTRDRLSVSRGNLTSQANDLERLGAKLRKKLPETYQGIEDEAGESNSEAITDGSSTESSLIK